MYRLTLPLQPELELAGVYDLAADRSARMAALTGSKAYRSFEELLEDHRIELVVNLTNPRAHFSTTLACLESGKHVYTEKPLAMQFIEAEQLARTAKERGLLLSSAPCTLLNEAAQTLWKAVREERVGKIRLVYAEMEDGMVHRMPYQKWINEAGTPWPFEDEFETGCTIEHAGYVLTWLCAMFGPAESLTAFAESLVPEKLENRVPILTPDYTVASIRFRSGVVARLTSGIFAPHDHRMQLFGDDGVMLLTDPRDDWSPLTIRRYVSFRRGRKLLPWGRRYPLVGGKRKQAKYRGSQRRNFCTGIAEMEESIRQGRECRLSTEFCLHVNEITLAIQNANRATGPYVLTSSFSPILPMDWAL